MEKKFRVFNKSDITIIFSVDGMRQTFKLLPNTGEFVEDLFFLEQIREQVDIFEGKLILEEVFSNDHAEISLSNEGDLTISSDSDIVLVNKSTKEHLDDLSSISQELDLYDQDGTKNQPDININGEVNEELNRFYVNFKLGLVNHEVHATVNDMTEEQLREYLVTSFNVEDTESNNSIIKAVYEEVQVSKATVDLLNNLKTFNHDSTGDDVSLDDLLQGAEGELNILPSAPQGAAILDSVGTPPPKQQTAKRTRNRRNK